MQHKLFDNVKFIYFMLVAVLMYYFLNEVIAMKIFITYRHAFALVIAGTAVMVFLIKPNIARGVTAFKEAVIYSIPLAVTIMSSLIIWSAELIDTDAISRGLSSSLIYTNMFSFALAGVAFLYIFGEKGIWYNLIAILTANILMLCTIVIENGLGKFLSELTTLIVTFADVTGEVIVQAEIHELAFCIGAYLIYMLIKPKKSIVFWILFALSMFCFIAAFKRIAIIAVVVVPVFAWALKWIAKYSSKTAFTLTILFSIVIVILLLLYIALIKMDMFKLLQSAGIETSGRVEIYDAVDKFYEFSPGFMGNGIGFLTYKLNTTNMNVEVNAVHNDFLQYFVDLGFWGYILWLISMTVLRVWHFGKNNKTENAILAFSLILYLIIVSSTDNTMNYPLVTTVLAVIMIGDGFNERVRNTEKKIFGSISDENKYLEGEDMI